MFYRILSIDQVRIYRNVQEGWAGAFYLTLSKQRISPESTNLSIY